ncbi:MAG: hypothetical protein HZA95_04295 [Candidatus Vogelbacteria bacterium]|nr:hypothetical protein [Candidatus Vogelbacteria bacterium]
MDEFPASYSGLFDEEQRRQGRYWLRVVMLKPELTFRILRYIYTQSEPRLSRFVDSLVAEKPRDEVRARMGFPLAVRSQQLRHQLRADMGPVTFSDLASVFREMPHLEELNLWRRKSRKHRGTIDFEGLELLAAYARDVVDQHPVVNGMGLGIGWGPWPDLREVGVSESGNVILSDGSTTHYCKQFAFWSDLPLERMLRGFDPRETDKLGVWEICIKEEPYTPFWIGLYPDEAKEHRAMQGAYGLRNSIGESYGMRAVMLQENEIDLFAARNQGIMEAGDEIARRFHEAQVHRNQSAVINVTHPPLRFVLET